MLNQILTTITLAAVLFMGTADTSQAMIGEPDVVYYGTATSAASGSSVTITLDGSTASVASYGVGSDLKYVLRVPMDSVGARVPGTARTGDTAVIAINGALAAKVVIPARGTFVKMDVAKRDADQWGTDHPGDIGSGDLNRNGIPDLTEYLDGKDPAGCVWKTVDATHAESDVFNPQVLKNCLVDAGNDQKHNLIRLAKGSYAGNFSYSAAWGEEYDLTLIGGYDPVGVAERSADPALTILNGDSDNDGAGNGITLAVDTDSGKTHGKVYIESLTVKNGTAPAGQKGGGIQARIYQGALELAGNIISGNGADNGGGLSVDGSDSAPVFLTNNVIYGNSAANAAAVRIVSASGPVILLNNSIADNTASAAGNGRSLLIESSTASVDLTNNIIQASAGVSGSDIYINSSGVTIPLIISHNVYDAVNGLLANSPGFTADANAIAAAPQFVNPAAGNYRLSPVSQCIDKGIAHAKLVATDAGGAGRTSGGSVDLGAYEFHGSVTNPATALILDGATLNGTVNANNADTTVSFEYGADTGYGSTVAAVPGAVTGVSDTAVSAIISGLSSGIYHFRVAVTSSAGMVYGGDQSFTLNKSGATVSLGNLSQTYDGTAKAATATTTPAGKSVTFTYDGNATAPTNVGSYAVVATIVDGNYSGSASGTLIIGKANQTIGTIGFSPATLTVNGAATANATATSGLGVTFTSTTPAVCSVTGAVVTSKAVGTCTIAANQSGSESFNPAPQATQNISASDITAPALALSTLADKAITANDTLNVAGTVSDAESGVKSVTVNGKAAAIANGSFTMPVSLVDGPNIITTIVTDNSDNKNTDIRTITLDRNAPGVTVDLPTDNSVTGKAFVDIRGSVDDLAATVSAKVNGGSAASATMNGTNFSATLNLTSGLNTIDIIVTDLAGNSSSSKRTITSDTAAPTLAVTVPAQDISTTQGSIVMRGTVSDSVTSPTVSMTVDGEVFAPTMAADGSFSRDIAMATDKTYAVIVTATDMVGNKATVQRNIIKTSLSASGDINGDGVVDIADALKALRIASDLDTATADNNAKGDVAPLMDGKPAPDGVIDIADAVVIMQKAVGLVSW